MNKKILNSIIDIKERIKSINETLIDYEEKKLKEKYCLKILKLDLIEIGEESKMINDILLEEIGSWDEILSKSYNMRISLTHYYKEINKEIIISYIKNRFPQFIEKIKELEIKYK